MMKLFHQIRKKIAMQHVPNLVSQGFLQSTVILYIVPATHSPFCGRTLCRYTQLLVLKAFMLNNTIKGDDEDNFVLIEKNVSYQTFSLLFFRILKNKFGFRSNFGYWRFCKLEMFTSEI